MGYLVKENEKMSLVVHLLETQVGSIVGIFQLSAEDQFIDVAAFFLRLCEDSINNWIE